MSTAMLMGSAMDDVMHILKYNLRDSDIHSPDRIYRRSCTW